MIASQFAFSLVLSLAIPQASAARGGEPAADAAKMDTTSAIRSALDAQRIFERIRLNNMPYGPAGGRDNRCDEFIGRFCYTYGDRSEIPDDPPPEKDEVIAARTKLITRLDSLVADAEASDWLLGTLVRYKIEAGDTAGAARALEDCDATPWWCSALQGYIAHQRNKHADAERAFDRARSLMSKDERCAWDDLGKLLAPADRKTFALLSCDERIALAKSAWWLAQPLMSREGNDRRSEHDSRMVLQRIAANGVNPTWLRWDDDMDELLSRFGWPRYWRRYWKSMADPALPNPQVSAYHAEPSYHFIPSLAAVRDPSRADATDWNLLPEYSHEEYSPSGVMFGKMEQQSARFMRGDSLLLISRVSVEGDSILRRARSLATAVVLSRSPDDEPIISRAVQSKSSFVLEQRTSNSSGVASIEIFGDSIRAARARFGKSPITHDLFGHAISDVLLFDSGGGEVTELARAAATMRSSLAVPRDTAIGIYWEVYGLQRDDRVAAELSVEPEQTGFLRRVGEALRLVGRREVAQINWEEKAVSDGKSSRSLTLNNRALKPGWYTLRLSISVNGETPLATERRIEVRK